MYRERLFRIYFRIPTLIWILCLALIFLITLGVTIHLVEPDTFHTVFDGIWWAITTAATIGYGDFIPKTVYGKLTTIVLVFSGTGLLTYYLSSVAKTVFSKQAAFQAGKVHYKGKNQMIIIGWNERSKQIINDFRIAYPNQPIILIDATVNQNPMPSIHFIKGNGYDDETFKKAGLVDAKRVIITANPDLLEIDADMKTIMTILTVKNSHPSVYTIAEILTASQIENAKRAGADHIIETTKLTCLAFAKHFN